MLVRERKPSDLEEISRLYFDTVRLVNSRDYTPEQIVAWAPRVHGREFWEKRWDRGCAVFVAEEAGEILGFTEFRSHGEVDCFYVHHAYQGRGVGKMLLETVEQRARELGVTKLFADVSRTARPFFLSRGFVAVREQLSDHNGQRFQQTYMERTL